VAVKTVVSLWGEGLWSRDVKCSHVIGNIWELVGRVSGPVYFKRQGYNHKGTRVEKGAA